MRLGAALAYALMAVNVVAALVFMLSAFSPYIHPTAHRYIACLGLAFPIFLAVNIGFLVWWLVTWQRKFAMFQLLVLLVCFGAIRTYLPINLHSNHVPKDAMKVLSYNILSFGGLKMEDGHNEVLDYLKDSDADIICLQEYAVTTSKNMVREKDVFGALSDYKYRHVEDDGLGGIALFSKYPILSRRNVDYVSNANSSVMYELKVGEDTLLLINNHLESNKLSSEDKSMYSEMLHSREREQVEAGSKYLLKKLADAAVIRSSQADTIAKMVRESKHKYMLVCGDFNDTPISYVRRKICENLNDAFVHSGRGFGISYNRNSFYFRIDHIMTGSNITTYNCTVDRSIKASDHYPIWCYMTLDRD